MICIADQKAPQVPDRLRLPSSAKASSPTTIPTYENNIPRATASPFKQSKPTIVFITDKLDFYVSDFITSYEHTLPHVVMVNQGYGSFDKGQVTLSSNTYFFSCSAHIWHISWMMCHQNLRWNCITKKICKQNWH